MRAMALQMVELRSCIFRFLVEISVPSHGGSCLAWYERGMPSLISVSALQFLSNITVVSTVERLSLRDDSKPFPFSRPRVCTMTVPQACEATPVRQTLCRNQSWLTPPNQAYSSAACPYLLLQIPVVDFSAEEASVVKTWRRACIDHGFLYCE